MAPSESADACPKMKVVDNCESKNDKVQSGVRKKNNSEGMEFIAPDGGWGWVVVAACGLSNFTVIPLLQNFGLIYKEKFEEWGISQAEYSFMRNVEFSVCSSIGLLAGALLRRYGYRKMAIIGASLCAASLAITSQVTSITNFIIFFGVLGGCGRGIMWPSNALAINTYFKKRRDIATGLAWTATGLSNVLMPHLITLLMNRMDVHGTVLILSGITLNAIPMALLLQPAHWHGKWVPTKNVEPLLEVSEDPEEQKTFLKVSQGLEGPKVHQRRASLRRGQVEGLDQGVECIVDTQSTLGLEDTGPISRHSSVWSLASTKARYNSLEFEECRTIGEEDRNLNIVINNGKVDQKKCEDSRYNEEMFAKRLWKRFIRVMVDFLDLTILKDPKFLLILIGMTIAYVAEVNFTILAPFVYAEFGFDKNTVALFMSMMAMMDLAARFTVPFIVDNLKLDPKVMYTIGLVILGTGRIVFAHMDEYNAILVATLWFGFGKGLRTVFMALVMPSYVPLDRLPTASGLQLMANGVMFICIGPFFGYIRDNSASYTASLHCINIFTFGTAILWSVEMILDCCSRRNSKNRSK